MPESVLGEWRYGSTPSLTSALGGDEWSASRPGRFTPRERTPGTHWIGGWVGPRSVLDAVKKRKIPSPRRESNPRTPIVQPVAQRYTDGAITALNVNNICISSTIRCIGEIDMFSNTGPHNVPYVLSICQYGHH
jgi:hypothetical protein